MSDQDLNFLNLTNFSIVFPKLPSLKLKLQTADIPGLTLGSADQPTPFGTRIPHPGNIQYDDFNVSFLTAENLGGWFDIFDWMTRLGHPDDLQQYPTNVADIYDDLSVIIRNSASNPIATFTFVNAFPVSLSPLNFDATLSEPTYAISTATFRYMRYYLNRTD